MTEPTHVPLPEAARAMGLSDDTLRRMVHRGDVPRWAVLTSGAKRPRVRIARAWFARAPVAPAPTTIEAGALAFTAQLRMAVAHG